MGKKTPHGLDDTGPSNTRMTAEGRESQLIALAYDLVEQRLRDGTATSQETTHFLKLGSMKERKEEKLLDAQIKLAEAKADAYRSGQHIEELIEDAMNAVKSYQSTSTSTMLDTGYDNHG